MVASARSSRPIRRPRQRFLHRRRPRVAMRPRRTICVRSARRGRPNDDRHATRRAASRRNRNRAPVGLGRARLGARTLAGADLFGAACADAGPPFAIWPIPPSWDLINHWAHLTLYGMSPADPLAALYQIRLTPIPISRSISPTWRYRRCCSQIVAALAWCAAIVLPAWGRLAGRQGAQRRTATGDPVRSGAVL